MGNLCGSKARRCACRGSGEPHQLAVPLDAPHHRQRLSRVRPMGLRASGRGVKRANATTENHLRVAVRCRRSQPTHRVRACQPRVATGARCSRSGVQPFSRPDRERGLSLTVQLEFAGDEAACIRALKAVLKSLLRRFGVRCTRCAPMPLHALLAARCRAEGVSTSAVVERLLAQWLDIPVPPPLPRGGPPPKPRQPKTTRKPAEARHRGCRAVHGLECECGREPCGPPYPRSANGGVARRASGG